MAGHVITISGMGAVAGTKPPLLERDAELARLGALLGNAQAGSGSVVAVSGPAGIGKTELLTAVHRLAGDRGFRSLRARGRELEAGMAFSVVRQLLEQPVLSASAGERRRLLAGPARAGAGALGLAAGDAPASEFAAVHGLYWLCVNLADRQPLLLTVDDLQWVDGPSLSWLAYLGPRAAESPVLMVLTVREDDPRGRANSAAAAADDRSVYRMGLSGAEHGECRGAGPRGTRPDGERGVLLGVLGARGRQPAVCPGTAGCGAHRGTVRSGGRRNGAARAGLVRGRSPGARTSCSAGRRRGVAGARPGRARIADRSRGGRRAGGPGSGCRGADGRRAGGGADPRARHGRSTSSTP